MVRSRRAIAAGAALAVLAGASVAPATGAAVAGGPGAFEEGKVVTLVGPGNCSGPARPDQGSGQVRAVAVDGEGRLWLDTGRPGGGLVGRVGIDGRAMLVDTGVRAPLAPAGTLAPDGEGGVFLAAADRLIRVLEPGSPVLMVGALPGGYMAPPGTDRLHDVRSIASADDGNLFLADATGLGSGLTRIRFFNYGAAPVTFYAGTASEIVVGAKSSSVIAGGSGLPVDAAGPARFAPIEGDPVVLAVAGSRLYVAAFRPAAGRSTASSTIRVINLGDQPTTAHGVPVAPGMSAVVAGGPAGYRGDGGEARSARFSAIPGISAGGAGDLYVADEGNHRIRRIDDSGMVSTVAGHGGTGPNAGGYDGNEQPARNARLDRPFDVKVGPRGWLYIADRFNHQVRYVDARGVIRAAPGSGVGQVWECTDPARIPPVAPGAGLPVSVTTGGDGDAWVLDEALNRLSRVGPDGTVTPLITVRPSNSTCMFAGPCPAVVAGRDGALYVRDGPDGAVSIHNPGPVPVQAHGLTVGPGASRHLLDGKGHGTMAAAPDGSLYVADRFASTVRRVAAGGEVTTVVDRSSGPGRCCVLPSGLAVDGAGNLYVADGFPGGRIWLFNHGASDLDRHGTRILPGGVEAVAVKGALEGGFEGDGGPAVEATLRIPGPLAVDGQGNLYIADLGEQTVRRVDAAGIITTAVGTGTTGFNGDHHKGPLTILAGPTGIATDRCGNLLIADPGNDRVRRLNVGGPCWARSAAARPPEGPSPGRGRLALGVLALVVVTIGLIAAARSLRASNSGRPDQ